LAIPSSGDLKIGELLNLKEEQGSRQEYEKWAGRFIELAGGSAENLDSTREFLFGKDSEGKQSHLSYFNLGRGRRLVALSANEDDHGFSALAEVTRDGAVKFIAGPEYGGHRNFRPWLTWVGSDGLKRLAVIYFYYESTATKIFVYKDKEWKLEGESIVEGC
jgi:hypothetical protein